MDSRCPLCSYELPPVQELAEVMTPLSRLGLRYGNHLRLKLLLPLPISKSQMLPSATGFYVANS